MGGPKVLLRLLDRFRGEFATPESPASALKPMPHASSFANDRRRCPAVAPDANWCDPGDSTDAAPRHNVSCELRPLTDVQSRELP